jgi:hypothetical protein
MVRKVALLVKLFLAWCEDHTGDWPELSRVLPIRTSLASTTHLRYSPLKYIVLTNTS